MPKLGEQLGPQEQPTKELVGRDFFEEHEAVTQTPFSQDVTLILERKKTQKELDEIEAKKLEDEFFTGGDVEFYRRDLGKSMSKAQELVMAAERMLASGVALTSEQEHALEALNAVVVEFNVRAGESTAEELQEMYHDYHDQSDNIGILEKLTKGKKKDKKKKVAKKASVIKPWPPARPAVEEVIEESVREYGDNEFSDDGQENDLVNNFFNEGEKAPEQVWTTNLVREREHVASLLDQLSYLRNILPLTLQIQRDIEALEDFFGKYNKHKLTDEETLEFFEDVKGIEDAKVRLKEFYNNNKQFLDYVPPQEEINAQKVDTMETPGVYEQSRSKSELESQLEVGVLQEKIATAETTYRQAFVFMLFDDFNVITSSAYFEVAGFLTDLDDEEITVENLSEYQEKFNKIEEALRGLERYNQGHENNNELKEKIIEKQRLLMEAHEVFQERKAQGIKEPYIEVMLNDLKSVLDAELVGDIRHTRESLRAIQYYINTWKQEQVKEVEPPVGLPGLEQEEATEVGRRDVMNFESLRNVPADMERSTLLERRQQQTESFDTLGTEIDKTRVDLFDSDLEDETVYLKRETVGSEQTVTYRPTFVEGYVDITAELNKGQDETLPLAQAKSIAEELGDTTVRMRNAELPTLRVGKEPKERVDLDGLEAGEPTQRMVSPEYLQTSLEALQHKLRNAFHAVLGFGEQVHYLQVQLPNGPKVENVLRHDITKGLFNAEYTDAALFMHNPTKDLFSALFEKDSERALQVLGDVEKLITGLNISGEASEITLQGIQGEISTLRALLYYPTSFDMPDSVKTKKFLGQLPYQCEYVASRIENVEADQERLANIDRMMGQVALLLDGQDNIQQECLNALDNIKDLLEFEGSQNISGVDLRERLARYYASLEAYDKFTELIGRQEKSKGFYQSVLVGIELNHYKGGNEALANSEETVRVSSQDLLKGFEGKEKEDETGRFDTSQFMEEHLQQQRDVKRGSEIVKYDQLVFRAQLMQQTNQIGKYNSELFKNSDLFAESFTQSVEILRAFSNHNPNELAQAERNLNYVFLREQNFQEDIKAIQEGLRILAEINNLLQLNKQYAESTNEQERMLAFNTSQVFIELNGRQYRFNFDDLSVNLDLWVDSIQNLTGNQAAYELHRERFMGRLGSLGLLFDKKNEAQLFAALRENARANYEHQQSLDTQELKRFDEKFKGFEKWINDPDLQTLLGSDSNIEAIIREARIHDHEDGQIMNALEFLRELQDKDKIFRSTANNSSLKTFGEEKFSYMGIGNEDGNEGLNVYIEGVPGRSSFSAIELVSWGRKEKEITRKYYLMSENTLHFDVIEALQSQF